MNPVFAELGLFAEFLINIIYDFISPEMGIFIFFVQYLFFVIFYVIIAGIRENGNRKG